MFRIYLPATDGFEVSAAQPQPEAVPTGDGETILVVDDDEQILSLTREALEDFGYTVLTASSGEEALAVYAEKMAGVAMVIMDLGMPGMGGRQCLRELLAIDSNARIFIASGYADNRLAEDLHQAGAKGFLGKPYQFKELAAKLREVLDR